MKLYVSSTNSMIDRETAKHILKNVGITKEIDGFSDCLNNCTCFSFKEGLEIRFDFFKRVDSLSKKLTRWFVNPIKNIFIKKDELNLVTFQKMGGYTKHENKEKIEIYLFLDMILDYRKNITNTIRHELLHIFKPIGHCDKLFCLFNNKNRENQVDFCDDCKSELNKIIDNINN